MTSFEWWIAYLAAGALVASWLWHTSHEDAMQLMTDVGFPVRVSVVLLYVVAIVFWPIIGAVLVGETVRNRRRRDR